MKYLIPVILAGAAIIVAITTALAQAHGALSGPVPSRPYLYGYGVALLLLMIAAVMAVKVARQERLPSSPTIRTVEKKANIKLLEIKNVEGSISGGKVYGIQLPGSGPLPTVVVCLRNHSAKGQVPKQPEVNAHIIYRDSRKNEIGSISHGVWVEEHKDYATLAVGEKKCLVLLVRTREGKLSMVWQESYYHQSSFMTGKPSFRMRDSEISRDPVTIVVELLDHWSGALIKRFVLRARKSATDLPTLKAQSAFWSFLRRD